MPLDCLSVRCKDEQRSCVETPTDVKIRTSITHYTSGCVSPLGGVKTASEGLAFIISPEEIHAIRRLWNCLGIHCPFCPFPNGESAEPQEESRSTLWILRGVWPCVQTPSEGCSFSL